MIDESRLYEVIGSKIRQMRQERGYSQAQLAIDIGLERTSISNIETGKQKITIASLYRLSQVLKIPLDELLPLPEDIATVTVKQPNYDGTGRVDVVGAKTSAMIEKMRNGS